jgi:hypothetical protein
LWTAYALLTSTFLLFCLFEAAPGLVGPLGLEGVRYFGLRSRYRPDPVLVLAPRRTDFTRRGRTRGDLYSPDLGIDGPWQDAEVSFDGRGFRRNGAGPPYDVLVTGDSYVATGERDDDTLSERLRAASGLATYNLGRGWYGPPQYVELLRRFGPELRPRYALFCFFDGNDMEDIRQHRRWSAGGSYYDFGVIEAGFFRRYGIALRDTGRFLWSRGAILGDRLTPADRTGRAALARIGQVRLGGRSVVMRFGYLPVVASSEDLLRTEEWRHLRGLLAEFRSRSCEHGIAPLVVFLPTKFQVYAPFLSPAGTSEDLLAIARERSRWERSSANALLRIAADLEIEMIDLTPSFREHASRGDLLYHPFDTHWNSAGRQLAAERIAERLRGLPRVDPCAPTPAPRKGG